MKTISDKEYERLILTELTNEKLKNENEFLHSKIMQYKITFEKEEKEKLIFWESKNIRDCNFKTACTNALLKAGINTVADLIFFCNQYERQSLLKLDGLGNGSYVQICNFLFEINRQ